MQYTAIEPKKVLKLSDNFNEFELINNYILILKEYDPKYNIDNLLYNENIMIINRSFLLLSLNIELNLEIIDENLKRKFEESLKKFLIKYLLLIKNHDKNYCYNVKYLYSLYNKLSYQKSLDKKMVKDNKKIAWY